MKINKEILDIFKEFKILEDDGVCYLLSLFYSYIPTYIPDSLKRKISASGIIKAENGSLIWVVPLFEGQETGFDWVEKEYRVLFEKANPDKKGNLRAAISRMKELFARDPSIRKHEVIEATKMYLNNNNPTYIRESQYFICKGSGAAKQQDILEWIDRYREQEEGYKKVGLENTLQ